MRRTKVVIVALAALLGCGGTTVGPAIAPARNNYAGAAAGAAFAAAAAGVNRAITGECWAMCRQGMVCDKASGLCVEPGSKAARAPAAGSKGAPSVGGEVNPAGGEYVVPPADACKGACGAGERCVEGDGGPPACVK